LSVGRRRVVVGDVDVVGDAVVFEKTST